MLSAKAQGPIYDLGPYPYRFYLAYSFLFGPYGPNPFDLIQSTSVLFIPFSKHWPYSVHIGPILSTLVLLSPHWSYLVHYLSYSVHYVHFNPLGPIRSILSTLVLFGPLCPLQSYSVHIGPIRSSMSTSILFGPFLSILSTPFLFGPLQSYSIHLVSISSILSIWSTLFHLVQFSPFDYFDPFLSTSIYFCALTKWEKTYLGWKKN